MSPSAPIPSDWKGFLRNDANKQDLFAFLAKEIEKCKVSVKQIVSTRHENVVCSSHDIALGNLAPCTQEEADTRLLLYAADGVKQGHSTIIIKTSDTDVVMLASRFHSTWVQRNCGHHSQQENISGILLSMISPPSLDLTSAKHCLSSMPLQGVAQFLSLQEGAN